jgi:predicted Zn-dependent protease
MKQYLIPALLSASLFFSTGLSPLHSQDLSLPELGGNDGGSLISNQQEYQLGRAWLMSFRAQVSVVYDPLSQTYIEQLLYKLANNSELKNPRLEVVIVRNNTLNAFAVPGGVVGVHSGLFSFSGTEDELASVLGHELAHLSQRHFQRGVEQQQRAAIPTMAGMLAGLVLAASGSGDAGMAAITASQAAALQNQLRYSRENEQEADRIGMETLNKAGYDPNAMASMFGGMQRSMRYSGNRPPEFLLTHPLTENRISDARTRAMQYSRKMYTDNLDFQLIKLRLDLLSSRSSFEAIKRYEAELKKNDRNAEAYHYALALAYTDTKQLDKAKQHLSLLLKKDPMRIHYILADVDIDIEEKAYARALPKLQKQLKINLGNHAFSMAYADVLTKAGKPREAELVLKEQSKARPNDPHVWYQLAETYGLSGNIIGVHQARAEYFILTGVLEKAQKQLSYALPLASSDKVTTARIRRRMEEIENLKDQLKAL